MKADIHKKESVYWLFAALPLCIAAGLASTYFSLAFLAPILLLLFICMGASLFFYPEFFFWCVILLAPFNDKIGISLGGFTLRNYTLFVLLISTWVGVRLLDFKPVFEITRMRELAHNFILLALFGASKILTLYVLHSYPPGMTKMFNLKVIIVQYFLFTAAYFTAAFLSKKERIYTFLYALFMISNGILFLALFQIIISNVTHFEFVHHRDVIFFGRPYSVFREPDVLGCFVATLSLMQLTMLLSGKHPFIERKTLIWSLAFSLFFVIILMVRAGWVAFIVGAIFILFCNLKLRRTEVISKLINHFAIGFLGVLVMLFGLAPSLAEKVSERLSSIAAPTKESASQYRKIELHSMVEHIKPKTWDEGETYGLFFGYGDFSWSYWGPQLMGNLYDQDARKNAHNAAGILIHPGFCMPIAILHDNGVVGLTIYILFIASMFRALFSLLNRKIDEEYKHLMICALSGVISIIICFEFSFDPIFQLYWTLTGFFWACYLIAKEQVKKI